MLYVDPILDETHTDTNWCHLASDDPTGVELAEAALALDLHPCWLCGAPEQPHYKLTPGKRVLALRLGAREVSALELVERCFPQVAGVGGRILEGLAQLRNREREAASHAHS